MLFPLYHIFQHVLLQSFLFWVPVDLCSTVHCSFPQKTYVLVFVTVFWATLACVSSLHCSFPHIILCVKRNYCVSLQENIYVFLFPNFVCFYSMLYLYFGWNLENIILNTSRHQFWFIMTNFAFHIIIMQHKKIRTFVKLWKKLENLNKK